MTEWYLFLPLICDDDNLKQSRDIEDTNEENSKGHVHLQEEEYEGGREVAKDRKQHKMDW